MEKAIYAGTFGKLNDTGGFSRIYYGAEFCQRNLPGIKELKTTFRRARNCRKDFTLLTPYLTESGLSRVIPLLEYLDAQDDGVEVVFNDWGLLKLIRERFSRVTPVLGRLLTKQRRDPRGYNVLFNKQEVKKIVNRKTQEIAIIIPKKVPPELYGIFQESVVNVPAFQDFLWDNGVRRVEVDNLVWEMKIALPPKFGISIYLPYAYITTTRLCGLINLSYRGCARTCRTSYLSFKLDPSPVPVYSRGNTVFYRSREPREEYLKERGIDRIVREREVPA